MKLTDIKCKNAKSKEKPYKLFDGGGLYLEVMTSGSKIWRFKYRFLGKEKRLTLGNYPVISLNKARNLLLENKQILSDGADPSFEKRNKKREEERNLSNSFKFVACEWHSNQVERWSKRHARDTLHRMEKYIFPHIGNDPLNRIDPPLLLELLRRIERRGALEMANRVKTICGQVFRYGIVTGRCTRDPSADLKGALKTRRKEHFPALDTREIPEFLAVLRSNKARLYPRTIRSILFSMLTFVRPGELRQARWEDIDFDEARWIIPKEIMKMGKAHLVPLSKQSIDILLEQKEESDLLDSEWVFPSQIRPQEPMSNGTVLMAIKRMGFKGRMTAHGFRAMARTTIREKLGYEPDIIERQLAHVPQSKVIAAYDRAQFLDQRIVMMQEWADYLDTL